MLAYRIGNPSASAVPVLDGDGVLEGVLDGDDVALGPVDPCERPAEADGLALAPVREAPDSGEMRPAATLASAAGTFKPDTLAQRCPVRRIERAEFRTNWHARYTVASPGTR